MGETKENTRPRPKSKPNKIGNMSLLKNSFVFSYIALLGVSLITIIEALRTPKEEIRHIMNVESSVSLVAGLVYSMFVETTKDLSDNDTLSPEELRGLTQIRYMDWAITTPMLLFVLLLFLTFYREAISIKKLLAVIGLNYVMLICGYLGETKRIGYLAGGIIGSVAYLLMLYVIWTFFILRQSKVHTWVFIAFAVIWSMYGVAYFVDGIEKQIMYNSLDVIAKGAFGLFLWLYFTKMIKP